MIGNKIVDRITKVSKTSTKNSLELSRITHDKEISKQRYISPRKNRKLLMIWDQYNSTIMEYQKIISLLDKNLGWNKWQPTWNV